MVSVNRVASLCCMGNTYGNLDALRRVGARYDNGAKMWTLKVEGHPLNNPKQRKKLEAMLTEMEENGVRFVIYYVDGVVKQ